MNSSAPPDQRKDLQDLHRLPRSAFWSHLHKSLRPTKPRSGGAPASRSAALLAAFGRNPLPWIFRYLRHRFGRAHPFQTYDARSGDRGVYQMPNDRRVVIDIAGDWATGTDEAEKVGRLMQADAPDYTIHLGDVYYVGDRDEASENFLGRSNPRNAFEPCAWPKGSLGSFALLGNHEMFARGYSYFDDMLPTLGPSVAGRSQGQGASFFCLENEHWRIIGLDTGYNSHGFPILEYLKPGDGHLRPEQLAWLAECVQCNPDDPRGVVLLSHHQYYSCFDDWFVAPAKQLAPYFPRPLLWFWGHEHRLAVYREFGVDGGLRAFGRCIGHGGMPVDLPPQKPKYSQCQLEFVDDRRYPNDEGLTIGFNGYARLAFDRDALRVDYVDIHGQIVFGENWRVRNGALTRVEAAALETPATSSND